MKKTLQSDSRKFPSSTHNAKVKKTVPVETKGGDSGTFPIVGLGASAGGLEALEKFFAHVPNESGLGFVVVQHLDPTQKGILTELLQRSTSMPVVLIKDRTRVEPNRVYVIPSNKDLSVLHGVLHLLEPAAPRGLRLPIDFFFRALADDQKDKSVGVILSGMGSDGTLGLRAIKERAGAVFVQEPASAKFDSMPRMAIDDGLVDVIAPAEEIPAKILEYLKHVPAVIPSGQALAEKDLSGLEKVVILLRSQTGNDFSLYKKSTIHRRIERRMALHHLTKMPDYVTYLRDNPQEAGLLFKELLIGVTSFFRDPEVWEHMRDKVVPDVLSTCSQGAALRAWTAGCSTGEEAYSLAIVFKEVLAKLDPPKGISLQIIATDLDSDAINRARAGVYPANISADVSEERLQRFFIKNEQGSYAVTKEIREMVIFAPQNIAMHPPFTKLDFVTCRNLLIYLDSELQKKLIPLFHYSLNPGGILLLGSAETIGAATNLFSPLLGKERIYRRLDTARQVGFADFPSAFKRNPVDTLESLSVQGNNARQAPNLQSLADQLLLQHYSPSAVLVSSDGDILYVSGKTGKYLEPAAGKANWNLFAMCREGLGRVLSEAFYKAIREKVVEARKGVRVGTNGGTQVVDVIVQPLIAPEAMRGLVLIVFKDVERLPTAKSPTSSKVKADSNAEVVALRQELGQARQNLQTTLDEMQTAQQELKSTNEELQSMNEELQSTNEELNTSKEEMQSMNEELQTVNHELQARVDDLSRASNDMSNLLNSTDIATLFLDEALLVRRFTNKIPSIIKLIPGDVGRPITDLAAALDYANLAEDAREVLRTFIIVEKQIRAHDGRWFSIRIMPYRTQDRRIDGVVITFTDITVSKHLEAELRKAQSALEVRFSRQSEDLGTAQENLKTEVNRHALPRQEDEQPPESQSPLRKPL